MFDVLVGKHGDHIGGERDAVRALLRGEADAACMIDANHLAFTREGDTAARLHAESSRRPPPTITATSRCSTALAPEQVARFRELLLAMSYADAEVRPLLDLEGLKAVGARPRDGLRAARRGRRSLRDDRRVRQRVSRRYAGRSRHRSGSPRAATCWSSAPCAGVAPGESISVDWTRPRTSTCDLRAWCRAEGHRFDWQPVAGTRRRRPSSRRGRGREPSGGRAHSACRE